jgi:hypothetical protein
MQRFIHEACTGNTPDLFAAGSDGVRRPGMDIINLVAAGMELERLNAKPQECVKK